MASKTQTSETPPARTTKIGKVIDLLLNLSLTKPVRLL